MAEARRAYRKWLTARILARMPIMPASIRRKMARREMRYADGRFYGYWNKTPAFRAASEFGPEDGRRIFIDVTRAYLDERTYGFSRVVKKLGAAMLACNPRSLTITAVRYDRFGDVWRYAKAFPNPALNSVEGRRQDSVVDFRARDIFLGIDWNPAAFEAGGWRQIRSAGVSVSFLVYDLVPFQMPHLLAPDFVAAYSRWAQRAAEIAGSLICISKATEDDLTAWLRQFAPELAPALGHFHLGSDIANPAVSARQSSAGRIERKPGTFLMVGTVEPRKGYRQVLEAFKLLWKLGYQIKLVIVGRRGWLVEDLVPELLEQTTHGRLVWLDSANDEELSAEYASATALLAASVAEGFGLPLVEAAQHSCPVIARDIPVFREILGEGAYYFKGSEPTALSNAIQDWLQLRETGKAPLPERDRIISWNESASQLCEILMDVQTRNTMGPNQIDHVVH
jgi:glycosyltransferase involved in cell wall biosynthesis